MKRSMMRLECTSIHYEEIMQLKKTYEGLLKRDILGVNPL